MPTDRAVLVIQCGGQKVSCPAAVRDLYLGPLWSSYRLAAGAGPRHPSLDVYVLSAEFGLRRESERAAPYDRVLVPDTFRGTKKGGTPVRRLSDLVALLRLQAYAFVGRPVHFAGGALYARALSEAGLDVRPLTAPGAGIGDIRSAVGRFAQRLDLDALIARTRPDGRGSAVVVDRTWFDGSKVVDAAGEPLVVFHGSVRRSGESRLVFHGPRRPWSRPVSAGGSVVGIGTFFSEDETIARSFAIGPGNPESFEPVVYAVYLRVVNPKRYTNIKALVKDYLARVVEEHPRFGPLFDVPPPVEFVRQLTAEGYDGVTFLEGPRHAPHDRSQQRRAWVVFDPSQVRPRPSGRGQS
jgi:hypothetical protein